MTPPVIQRWSELVDKADPSGLDELLADDAVFYSPAIFSPQQGKATTAVYLSAAIRLLTDGKNFSYTNKWYAERSAVLEFTAEVDGMYVNGVDIVEWNDDDKIVSFKVMLRPFKGLQTVMGRMAELLQA
jgi:SnoaL-like protein